MALILISDCWLLSLYRVRMIKEKNILPLEKRLLFLSYLIVVLKKHSTVKNLQVMLVQGKVVKLLANKLSKHEILRTQLYFPSLFKKTAC